MMLGYKTFLTKLGFGA